MMQPPAPSQTPPPLNALSDIKIGLGTWAWGDRLLWGFGRKYREVDVQEAFQESLACGVRLIDTAEVYGQGASEKLLGGFLKEYQGASKAVIASKFMPFPWRQLHFHFRNALTHSLKRLGIDCLDLYQVHIPIPPVRIDFWMDSMVTAVQEGLVRMIGVSNFDLRQMQLAVDILAKKGYQLASNQVNYSLLERTPEKNGVLDLCKQQGVQLIAYSPLAMGILSGKYGPDAVPEGIRSRRYNRQYLQTVAPLINQLRRIGAAHEGKSPSQVALNWVICKGALPIPGAKTFHQAQQNAGGTGWQLQPEEIETLDSISDQVLAKL
jgi:aryl-alcohol dehydrogenase-like predicted oxidoreductase